MTLFCGSSTCGLVLERRRGPWRRGSSRFIAALVVRVSEPIKPLVSITTTFLSIHSTQPSWLGRMVVFSQANHIPPAIRTLAWDITMLHPITFWLRMFPPILMLCREAMPRFTEMSTQMAGLWRQSLGQEISRANFTTITMSRCRPFMLHNGMCLPRAKLKRPQHLREAPLLALLNTS